MDAETESGVETLATEECWELVQSVDLGRVAMVLGDGVDIFPVNYVVTDQVIYFRSAPGSKMVNITENSLVAFEADGIADRRRWSVVVKGKASRMGVDTEIEESGVLDLQSFSPTDKWNYVQIDPVTVTGRRFTRARRSD